MIYIIGAGSIGKALAVFLKNAGKEVILIRGSVDDGTVHTGNIRVEMPSGVVHEAEIKIASLSAFDSLQGMVVLANKSYGNENLAITLRPKVGTSPVVLLQNGLGVERSFIHAGFEQIYRCVLFVQSIDQRGYNTVQTCRYLSGRYGKRECVDIGRNCK